MKSFLRKPKTKKYVTHGKGNQMEFSVSEMQGWRAHMEDRHVAESALKSLPSYSFFGVFDGHGGFMTAEICSLHLLREILKQDKMKELAESKCEESVDMVEDAIKAAFVSFDKKVEVRCTKPGALDACGSTAACVLISPTHYYFINCGDSRAILCRGGRVHFATADHKPYNPEEERRIKEAGGTVYMNRVNGMLAVSRAIGNYIYKEAKDKAPTEQLVSPEPDVTAIERDSENDEFIIIASDGVFDFFENEELTAYVLEKLKTRSDLNKIANAAVDLSFNRVSLLI